MRMSSLFKIEMSAFSSNAGKGTGPKRIKLNAKERERLKIHCPLQFFCTGRKE